MKYKLLLVVPQLGFGLSGEILPGGLQQFSRCLARALASSPSIEKLGIWSQVDPPGTESLIERMVRVHAHPMLDLDVRLFGGSQVGLAISVAFANLRKTYDHVMYALVNQAELAVLPWHLPYSAWEIGRELFQPVSWLKYRALFHASTLLSISENTTRVAARNNPGVGTGQVVYLCVEPPLFMPEPLEDSIIEEVYDPASRDRSVMIVANMHRGMLYKGHHQLIAAWTKVTEVSPEAELWIVGGGEGKTELEAQVKMLPLYAAKKIQFLGWLDDQALHERYRRCRVFAMPSSGEGFGLVFVEAARYGLPCIGGKYDGAKEVVLHNRTGLIVEQHPHDIAFACLRLLTDDRLAKRLGEAGRQRYLQHFRFQHFRARLLHTLGLDPGPTTERSLDCSEYGQTEQSASSP